MAERLDEFLRQGRDSDVRESARRNRLRRAFQAFLALRPDEQKIHLRRIMLRLELIDEPRSLERKKPVKTRRKADRRPLSIITRTERTLRTCGRDGSTVEALRVELEASESVIGTALEHCKSRGTVVKVDGRWYALDPRSIKRPTTIRTALLDVLADGRARSTLEIFEAVRQSRVDTSKGSLAAEVSRLKRDRLIEERGTDVHGPLYGLLDGGGSATA